jgi:hypothetical protein
MTDAGPLDLIDDSDDESNRKNLSLPAVRKGKMILGPNANCKYANLSTFLLTSTGIMEFCL